MKAKTKIKTLLLGATLATAFAAVGAYGLPTEYETFNTTTITADAASAPYSGTPVEPTKITSENYTDFGFADETYVGYYAITNAEELYGFRNLGKSEKVVLTQDIVVNTTVSESGATHTWSPLFSVSFLSQMYQGTFDGNGYSISGLYITSEDSNGVGFIASMYGGEIKNLILKNTYVTSSRAKVAALVGQMSEGSITNCRIESTVTVKSTNVQYIGGMVGMFSGDAIMTNCMSAATVSAPYGGDWCGTLVGAANVNTTMSNCYYVLGTATNKNGVVGGGDNVTATALTSATASHTHVSATHKGVAATCKADGLSEYTYCVVCDEVLSGTKTTSSALGHTHSYTATSERIYPNGAGDTSSYYDNYTITETCANCSHSETAQFRFVEGTSRVYTGEAITPYEIVYSDNYAQKETGAPTYTDNVNVGVATVSKDFYDIGALSLSFTIEKATPKAADFVITPPADLTYNGEQKTASVSVANDIVGMGDVTTTFYKDGVATTEIVDAGEYTVIINVAEGDNYTAIDDLTVGSFIVQPRWIMVSDISLSNDLVEYNGEAQEPTVSVVVDGKTLVLGTEYDLSWNKTGFVNADVYAVTVIGKGNYAGEIMVDYLIVPKSIENSEIAIDVTEVTYDGNAHEPTITVKDGEKTLAKDTDYTLTWDKSGFVNADTYTATIEGINNYDGTYTRTLVIHKETLVLELSAPILKVLPGNQIALTLTVNSTEGTPVWNVVGGTHVSGTTVKIDDSLVIGQDKVMITVTYAATTNYTGGSKTIELEVGMADFTAEINTLEEDVSELQTLIADKADSATVNTKLNELLGKIEALEAIKEDYKGADQVLEQTLTQAIDNAKQEAVNAAQTNLTNAVDTLNQTIATEDGKLNDRITDEVKALNEAIDLAEDVAAQADAALKTNLEGQIATAQTTLQKAIDKVQDNLETAVDTLNQTIATEDGKLNDRITDEVKALNEAIDLAEDVAAQADAALKTNLEGQIATAQNTLQTAIDKVQENLDNAVEELSGIIASGDEALTADLEKAVADLNAAIELAKKVAAESDEDLETKLTQEQASFERYVKEIFQSHRKAIEDAKAEARVNDILPIVLGSVGIAGNLTIAIVWVILKRKKVK